MKQWFGWERNNNRPRYLNVRAKSEDAPALRIAVDNSDTRSSGRLGRMAKIAQLGTA